MTKFSTHPASEENPGFLLWRVSTLWSSSTAVALKQFGLTHPHFVLLATIDRLADKGASQEEIGRYIVLDPKPTAHLLRSLQVKGLIELSEYPVLTPAGKELLAKILPVIENADKAFFASIDLSKMIPTFQTLSHANFSKHDRESCCLSESDEG